MDTFLSLRVFREVVESGSFVAAAERLELSPAMVSKHVMHLERQVGTRLLTRTSRRSSLTDHGKRYFEKCRIALDNLEEAKYLVHDSMTNPGGILRILVPSWFTGLRFASALAAYQMRFPNIVLDVKVNNLFSETFEEDIDVSISMRYQPPSPNLKAVWLNKAKFIIAGSPSYLNRFPPLLSVSDLARHRFITFPSSNRALESQIIFEGSSGTKIQEMQVSFFVDNASLLCQAAVAGMGLALIPEEIIQSELESGSLKQVFDQNLKYPSSNVYMICSNRRYFEPKIKSFMEFISQHFSEGEKETLKQKTIKNASIFLNTART